MKTAVINNGISDNFEVCCTTMRSFNITHVEIQRVNGVPVENCTPDNARDWRRTCDTHGITPVCVTTHAFGGVPVDSVEVNDPVFRRHFDLLRNGFDIARELNAPFVRSQTFTKAIVTWGSHGAEQWMAGGNAAWPKFLKLFEPAVKLAEERGIDLLVETCFNSMNSTAALNRKLIDDIGSKRLKLLWDPCNALLFGEYPTLET